MTREQWPGFWAYPVRVTAASLVFLSLEQIDGLCPEA